MAGDTLGFRVELRGFTQMGRALAIAEPTIKKAAMAGLRTAVRSTAVQAARRAVPHRSGRLARSINVRSRGSGARGNLTLGVGTSLVYAPVLEYASKGRWTGLNARYGAPPRFITPAVEATTGELAAATEAAAQAATDQVFGSLPGRV